MKHMTFFLMLGLMLNTYSLADNSSEEDEGGEEEEVARVV